VVIRVCFQSKWREYNSQQQQQQQAVRESECILSGLVAAVYALALAVCVPAVTTVSK